MIWIKGHDRTIRLDSVPEHREGAFLWRPGPGSRWDSHTAWAAPYQCHHTQAGNRHSQSPCPSRPAGGKRIHCRLHIEPAAISPMEFQYTINSTVVSKKTGDLRGCGSVTWPQRPAKYEQKGWRGYQRKCTYRFLFSYFYIYVEFVMPDIYYTVYWN